MANVKLWDTQANPPAYTVTNYATHAAAITARGGNTRYEVHTIDSGSYSENLYSIGSTVMKNMSGALVTISVNSSDGANTYLRPGSNCQIVGTNGRYKIYTSNASLWDWPVRPVAGATGIVFTNVDFDLNSGGSYTTAFSNYSGGWTAVFNNCTFTTWDNVLLIWFGNNTMGLTCTFYNCTFSKGRYAFKTGHTTSMKFINCTLQGLREFIFLEGNTTNCWFLGCKIGWFDQYFVTRPYGNSISSFKLQRCIIDSYYLSSSNNGTILGTSSSNYYMGMPTYNTVCNSFDYNGYFGALKDAGAHSFLVPDLGNGAVHAAGLNADYTHKSTSKLINKGTSSDALLTVDFAGNPLSKGAAPDCGPYEYQLTDCNISSGSWVSPTILDVTMTAAGGGTAIPTQISAEIAGNWNISFPADPTLLISTSVKQSTYVYRLTFNKQPTGAQALTVTAPGVVTDFGGYVGSSLVTTTLATNCGVSAVAYQDVDTIRVTFVAEGGGSQIPLQASATTPGNWSITGGTAVSALGASRVSDLVYDVVLDRTMEPAETIEVDTSAIATDNGGLCNAPATGSFKCTKGGLLTITQNRVADGVEVVFKGGPDTDVAPSVTAETPSNWTVSPSGEAIELLTSPRSLDFTVLMGFDRAIEPGETLDIAAPLVRTRTNSAIVLPGELSISSVWGGISAVVQLSSIALSVTFKDGGPDTAPVGHDDPSNWSVTGEYGDLSVSSITDVEDFSCVLWLSRPILPGEQASIDGSAIATVGE